MRPTDSELLDCIKKIRDYMNQKLNLRRREYAEHTFTLSYVLQEYREVFPEAYQLEWEYIHPIAV